MLPMTAACKNDEGMCKEALMTLDHHLFGRATSNTFGEAAGNKIT
jgi:hypothetical protein